MIRVDVDVGDFRLRHLDIFRPIPLTRGSDLDADRDGRLPNTDELSVKGDEVADEDGFQKVHLLHGNRHNPLCALEACLLRSGLIDVGKDDASENGASWIGIAWHHQDSGLRLRSTVVHEGLPLHRFRVYRQHLSPPRKQQGLKRLYGLTAIRQTLLTTLTSKSSVSESRRASSPFFDRA